MVVVVLDTTREKVQIDQQWIRWKVGPGSRLGIGGQVKTSLVNEVSEGSTVVKCFSCGERSYISTRCPAKPVLLCRSLSVNKELCKVGMVEGVCVWKAYSWTRAVARPW